MPTRMKTAIATSRVKTNPLFPNRKAQDGFFIVIADQPIGRKNKRPIGSSSVWINDIRSVQVFQLEIKVMERRKHIPCDTIIKRQKGVEFLFGEIPVVVRQADALHSRWILLPGVWHSRGLHQKIRNLQSLQSDFLIGRILAELDGIFIPDYNRG